MVNSLNKSVKIKYAEHLDTSLSYMHKVRDLG